MNEGIVRRFFLIADKEKPAPHRQVLAGLLSKKGLAMSTYNLLDIILVFTSYVNYYHDTPSRKLKQDIQISMYACGEGEVAQW